jgi:hypothetical protein
VASVSRYGADRNTHDHLRAVATKEWTLGETARAIGIAAVLGALTIVAYFVLPQIVVTTHDLSVAIPAPPGTKPSPAPTAADLLQARNGARTAAVALLAGLGAAFAAWFTARTYYLSRRAQLDVWYSTAVGQLDAQRSSVQVSAIGELERIARLHPERHRQIVLVLAAFVRDSKSSPDDDPAPVTLQTACDVLMKRDPSRDGDLRLNLTGADLRKVSLEHGKLGGASLRDARLEGALLCHCDLERADLTNAQAAGARFDDAAVTETLFDGVVFTGATLDRISGARPSFVGATYDQTFMRQIDVTEPIALLRADGSLPVGAIGD